MGIYLIKKERKNPTQTVKCVRKIALQIYHGKPAGTEITYIKVTAVVRICKKNKSSSLHAKKIDLINSSEVI